MKSGEKALREAAIEVLLHRACWCVSLVRPMCPTCTAAFVRLAELVGMKAKEGA